MNVWSQSSSLCMLHVLPQKIASFFSTTHTHTQSISQSICVWVGRGRGVSYVMKLESALAIHHPPALVGLWVSLSGMTQVGRPHRVEKTLARISFHGSAPQNSACHSVLGSTRKKNYGSKCFNISGICLKKGLGKGSRERLI